MSDIAFKVLIGNGYDDILFKTIMLKGEKGDQGEAGGAEIDDSTTSSTKTWSSSKINSEISAKPSAFSQLNDVAISSISDGQMPVYDFTTGKWKNQNVDASTLKYNSVKTIKDELDAKASSLTELDDVNITNPQNAEGMIYDATTGKWKNGNPAVSGNLDDLDDVQIDLNTLADGQAVKWDAQNNKWVNGAVSTTSALVDLTDVALDSSIPDFSSLVYIATLGKWANKKLTIACTEAQYETWKNASPSQLIPCTQYILTDAQNLNATANNIEYSSGITVKQAIDGKQDKAIDTGWQNLNVSYAGTIENCRYRKIDNIVYVEFFLTATTFPTTWGTVLGTVPNIIKPNSEISITGRGGRDYALFSISNNGNIYFLKSDNTYAQDNKLTFTIVYCM